jgi:hypothetical protein
MHFISAACRCIVEQCADGSRVKAVVKDGEVELEIDTRP